MRSRRTVLFSAATAALVGTLLSYITAEQIEGGLSIWWAVQAVAAPAAVASGWWLSGWSHRRGVEAANEGRRPPREREPAVRG